MKLELNEEEIKVIEGLKNIYKEHRKSTRFVSNDSPIAKLEAASSRLIKLVADIEKRYKKRYIAVVNGSEIVLYQANEDGTFSPVSYCEAHNL